MYRRSYFLRARILKEIIFSSSFLWSLKNIVTTLSKIVILFLVTIVLQLKFRLTRPKFSTQLGPAKKGRLAPAGIVPLGK